MSIRLLPIACLAALLAAAPPAGAAAPTVKQMVVFRDGGAVTRTVRRSRRASTSAGAAASPVRARRSQRSCAATSGRLRLRDFGSCSTAAARRRPACSCRRSAATATAGRTAGSTRWAGAAPRRAPRDPGGPFGRGRLRSRASGSPGSTAASAAAAASARSSWRRAAWPAALTATVRGYDDEGHGVAVEGATVTAAGVSGVTARRRQRAPGAPLGQPQADRGEGRARALVRGEGRSAVRRARRASLPACRRWPSRGCGLGEGEERGGDGVELRVTRDFGHDQLGAARVESVREGETVMRMLRSEFDIETRYGGRFVQAIDGLEGQGAGGERDWFYFVNGIEAERRRGRVRALARRPRAVGPPRLGRRHARAGDRRRIPRAVPARDRGQAAAGARGVRRRGGAVCRDARATPGARGRVDLGLVARGARDGDRDPARGGPLAAGADRPRRRRRSRRARRTTGVFARFDARRTLDRAARRATARSRGRCGRATAWGSCSRCARSRRSSCGS